MTEPGNERERVTAEMYARVFESHHEGALVFDDLVRRFARPPVLEGGIDAVLKTYHRNGARSVVEFITGRINQANGVDANVDPDE